MLYTQPHQRQQAQGGDVTDYHRKLEAGQYVHNPKAKTKPKASAAKAPSKSPHRQ